MLTALTLATWTAVNNYYIDLPQLSFAIPSHVIPLTYIPSEKEAIKKNTGALTVYQWGSVTDFFELNIQYTTYSPQSPPKLSVRQTAEFFYTESKKLSDLLNDFGDGTNKDSTLLKKFSDRQLTEFNVGAYPGYLDSHHDLITKRYRQILAFGNNEKRWKIEINATDESTEWSDAIQTILKSFKPTTEIPENIATQPDQPRALGIERWTINAPSTFSVFERSTIQSSRKGKQGHTSILRIKDLNIEAKYDEYEDELVNDTLTQASNYRDSLKDFPYQNLKTTITPFNKSPYTGHLLTYEYEDLGKREVTFAAFLAAKGKTAIIHVTTPTDQRSRGEAVLSSLVLESSPR